MTTLEIMLLIGVIGMFAAVMYRSFRPSPTSGAAPDSALLVQQQIDNLRGEVQQSLRSASETVAQSLRTTQEAMIQTLRLTNDQVSQQVTMLASQMQGVTSQLQENSGQMGTRLDNAAKVIQDVQKQLGALGQATQEIRELGQSVSKLEEVLRAPKLRGGLGELLLEDLLKQVLPVNAYKMQYRFRNGERVDAIIITAGGSIPVDSKFPLENFRKMAEAKSDQERSAALRGFRSDVKRHIDDIAKKYIVPDEGTFDFALMYIPAENIYYETIIKDEKFEAEDGLYEYATAKHVVPVSPNSFYAHLRVIALGFKGLQVEKSANEIINSLKRLDSELRKYREAFDVLGSHLTNAKNTFDKADKQLGSFEDKLASVQHIQDGAGSGAALPPAKG